MEIKDLKARLDAIDGWRSLELSPNPVHTNSISTLDEIIIKRDKLYREYLRKLNRSRAMVLEIEWFLDHIDDPVARTIIRLKYIDGLTWEEVGETIRLHRTTCYQKVCRLLEK